MNYGFTISSFMPFPSYSGLVSEDAGHDDYWKYPSKLSF